MNKPERVAAAGKEAGDKSGFVDLLAEGTRPRLCEKNVLHIEKSLVRS